MAVPGSPSLQDVVNEFGGPGDLRSYYRGGPYVPNVAQNQNVSTDPNQLELASFVGAVRYVPMSGNVSPNPVVGDGGPGSAGTTAYANISNGTPPYSYNWWTSVSSQSGVQSFTTSASNGQYYSLTIKSSPKISAYWNGTVYCTITDQTGAQITISAPVYLNAPIN
jgi:hypothetical protein